MFDISIPSNSSEIARLSIDAYSSEGLKNHKAILVSEALDLIAFPADAGYLVYGYADGAFYPRGSFPLESFYAYGARVVYLGSAFYVCSPYAVLAVDFADMQVLCTLDLSQSCAELSLETVCGRIYATARFLCLTLLFSLLFPAFPHLDEKLSPHYNTFVTLPRRRARDAGGSCNGTECWHPVVLRKGAYGK